jgi:choline/glycine/proline betaine transport protein
MIAHRLAAGNWSGYGFDLHPHVTFPSMAVLAVFILLALMFKEHAAWIFEVALEFITRMSG